MMPKAKRRKLKLTNGNREEAARLLDIGERTLYRKIKEYEIGSIIRRK
jgi:two-component system response regulator HydG